MPERREELTTEGGLDVAGQLPRMREACARLQAAGVRVSLFIDADPAQIDAAAESGAPCIEIHTGHFADATTGRQTAAGTCPYRGGSPSGRCCRSNGHAGHGLHYHNV